MKEFWQLYLIFARIGSITFGGGYAMLPILQRELVENRQWVTDEELMDYFAIGQCTPGIIALNVSTFIGNKRKGVLGGIIATLGFITIPIILIIIIALFLNNFSEYAIVKNAFAGIRVCVCVLILNAVERLWKKSIISKTTFLLFGVIFLLTIFTEIPLYLLVISSAVAGIVINALERSHA
ncbi:chromate transporter [Beduini massiliensis]|uniref:chromate transporter n=1 Tax=Beduini massiliensis TaxID=1585974 RepID=UPI00059A7DCE|nr:chromate transporter [Beduini massiliensis]